MRSFDGTELFTFDFGAPPAAPRGDVLIIHGYGDHLGRYAQLAGELKARGFHVRAFDLRGHGKSGGRRGYAASFDDYTRDLATYLAATRTANDRPLTVVAHSFGALVATAYVIAQKRSPTMPRIDRLVLSAPFLGLALKVPAWKRALAKVTSSLVPTLALPTGLSGDALSHDPAVARAYEVDPLVNKNATTRWFSETTLAQARVYADAAEITLPILMMHGDADSVADVAQTRAVFERIAATDKTLKLYEGQYHEIFNESEPARSRIVADLIAWLEAHTA
jgi:alpha-beta hydrolase superfamily lysophospholipase